ncbi:MAG: glycosyltransferase [Lachnospiraceae bacterium]|nr:glycosyltransferase [Lachnospiraceae bacterium]
MNILIIDIGSYMVPDIKLHLERAGHHCADVWYDFREKDKVHNAEFEAMLAAAWKKGVYDLVFSTNFLPVVAFFCQAQNVKYISWSYDCPLNLETEEGFDLPCNYIFLYDRMQVKDYRALGLDTVYHLPLAVNCERLRGTQKDPAFACDVSFMGTLYESTLPLFKSHMGEYEKGYLDALVKLQTDLYGTWLVDEMLTDAFVEAVNRQYRKTISKDALQLTKKQLSWSVATQITHINRISLLRLLSARADVLLCTNDLSDAERELLPGLRLHDRIDYIREMPRLFVSSKINLNISLRAIQTGIPLRALDVMGCGGFLLSNYQEEMAELLVPDEEVVLYESLEDAVEKSLYYLAHDAERERIAKAGLARMQQDFRYEDRIKAMFETTGVT